MRGVAGKRHSLRNISAGSSPIRIVIRNVNLILVRSLVGSPQPKQSLDDEGCCSQGTGMEPSSTSSLRRKEPTIELIDTVF